MTAEQVAAQRNALLRRYDIEWAVGPTGLYLRDKPSWSADQSRQRERMVEDDRRRWKSAQARPL